MVFRAVAVRAAGGYSGGVAFGAVGYLVAEGTSAAAAIFGWQRLSRGTVAIRAAAIRASAILGGGHSGGGHSGGSGYWHGSGHSGAAAIGMVVPLGV